MVEITLALAEKPDVTFHHVGMRMIGVLHLRKACMV